MDPIETIPYLSEATLAGLGISTHDVVESIERLIRGSERGTVWNAPKAIIQPGDGRYMMAAMAAMDNPSHLAVKTVILNPRNPDHGLPQINGLVTMLDSEAGLPAAILDGNWITAVRTAGLSAVAAKHMAMPDARVCSFVGCGVQARSHLQALSDLFPLQDIRLFGRGRANIGELCRLADQLGLSSKVCGSGGEAVEDADIVVTTVTNAPELVPFLDANLLKPGCFAALPDLGAPWNKDSFTAFDRIVIDDLEQEAAMPNKLAEPNLVTGDLSGLVLGRFESRSSPQERNAFLFRGHALGDLALASLAFEKFNES